MSATKTDLQELADKAHELFLLVDMNDPDDPNLAALLAADKALHDAEAVASRGNRWAGARGRPARR